ncbi:MAG: dickkopf-related protein [Polyangiaceae bacterium]
MALNTRIGPTAIAAALGLAALASVGSAHALTCTEVIAGLPAATQAHVIYGSGGSAITPTLSRVAYVLSKQNPPVFVFYQDGGGAAAGYQSFTGSTGGTTARPFRYWITEADVTANNLTCTADVPATGRAVDFATTGGTLALFDGLTLADDVGVFTGPTQGVNIIVPWDASERSISAEALYYVYGFADNTTNFTGVSNPVKWASPYVYRRSATAFVQQFLVGAIRTLGGNAGTFPAGFPVAAASSPDTNQGSVDNVIAAAAAGFTEQAIGFTSGPTADKNRGTGKVHTLAYKHTGQTEAYWPDSSVSAFDKINIRNGHYFLWDTNQFFTKITGSNANPTLSQIVKDDVKTFIGYFSGQVKSLDVTKAIIDTGSIPQCAMQVQRSTDFTGLSCYAPTDPCGCYFESITSNSAACDSCTKDSECSGSSTCHFGFCEAY